MAVIEKLPHYARFFFHELDNPCWFPLFVHNRVLQRAIARQNAIQPLTAVRYAQTCASKWPEHFVELARSLPPVESWLVSDLIEGALDLGLQHQREFFHIALGFTFEGLIDEKPVAEIVRRQMQHGDAALALSFLSAVAAFSADEDASRWRTRLQSRLSAHCFDGLSRGLLPSLVLYDAPAVVEFAGVRFDEALANSQPNNPGKLPTYEVASLHSSEVDLIDEYKQSIILAFRDVFANAVAQDPTRFRQVLLDQLISSERSARARVALYAAALHAPGDREILTTLLRHDWIWHELYILPELEEFIVRSWEALDDGLKTQVLQRVMSLHTFVYGEHVSGEKNELYRKRHVVNWLLLLKPRGYPASIEQAADTMRQEYVQITGRSEPIEHRGLRAVTVGCRGGVSEDFGSMEAGEVVAFFGRFEAKPDSFDEPEPSDLRSQLVQEVTRRPDEFLPYRRQIQAFQYPVFHSSFIDGLSDALRNDGLDDLEGGLELVLALALESQYPVAEHSFRNGTRSWVRESAAGFLRNACEHVKDVEHGRLELLFSAWSKLWPSADQTTAVGETDDWLTPVINSEVGNLALALGWLTVRSGFGSRSENEDHGRLSDLWIRLRAALERELIGSHNPLCRAPVGFFFSWLFALDEDWAKEHSNAIFDREDPVNWEAAWSCHFWVSQRHVSVFRHLIPHYEHAFTYLRPEEMNPPSWAERFADDIVIFWMAGVVGESDPIFRMFWGCTPDRVRFAAASWLGQHLKNVAQPDWTRAIAWWEKAVQCDRVDAERSHLDMYINWLGHMPSSLPLSGFVHLLVESVKVERHFLRDELFDCLLVRAPSEPTAVAQVMKAVASNKTVWFLREQHQILAEILVAAHRYGDADARKLVVDAQRELVARGFYDLRTALA